MSIEKKTKTRGAVAAADLAALLQSRHTLIWITSAEEARVETAIIESAGSVNYRVVIWDGERGVQTAQSATLNRDASEAVDPSAAIRWLEDPGLSGRYVMVMRDLHSWVRDPSLLRQLRSAHRRMQGAMPGNARAIVVLSPSAEIPQDLRGAVSVVDWPLPDRAEVSEILADTLDALPSGTSGKTMKADDFESAVDAAVGLSAEEAQNCYALSLVRARAVEPAQIAKEKKRIISRIPGLGWYDPDPRGLAAVGGLDVLKEWLATRRSAFSARARAYGLPTPKGCMIVGIPGTGKSLTAKALAAAWACPLIRWDVGAMRSKFVGDSEANVRRVIQILESIGQCVLWLDEIEKALAGASGPQGDGGVAADALGTILSWMQERTCPVFVVATANDVRALPPELLRKGRFDEVWWVDLPTTTERESIAETALAAANRVLPREDLQRIAHATNGFVGAEIAAIIPDAMYRAFADGERPLSAEDVLAAAATVTPLSQTASEKIKDLRDWAKGKARPASRAESEPTPAAAAGRRQLDL